MSETQREYLKGHIVKNWKRRYFILTSSELSYFTDEKMKSKQKTIPLDVIGTVKPGRDEDDHPNIINVTTDSDEYLFSCESSQERESWINCIQAARSSNPLTTTSKMVYARYHQEETAEATNAYYNRLVLNFCEAKSASAYLDSLLCLTAFFARIYSTHSKVVIDYESASLRCDHILETVKKQREYAQTHAMWSDKIENVYFDFIDVVTTLQEKIKYAIQMSQAIASGAEEAKMSPDTPSSESKESKDNDPSIPKTGFFKHYKLKAQLGSGAYSVVHEAINLETRERVAVKCINKSRLSKSDLDALKNEVGIMAKLDHPNIVKLIDYFEEGNMYYIVTELADGGELFDKIVEKKFYTEVEARDVIRTITGAISYCHERNVVHRDLKPENILLSSTGVIKLADFGFAKSMEETDRLHTDCGSPWYVAPEILESKAYGSEVDMWSLGVIIYIILSGFPPFHDNNQARLFRKIRSGHYTFLSPYWDGISEDAKDLIQHLLVVDPRLRFDAKQVLTHKWLTSTEVSSTTQLASAQEGLRAFIDTRRRHVLRQGYLMKQGHIIKNWKKRSFVLTAQSLSYYPDETSSVPKGCIDLSDITKVIDSSKSTNFLIQTKSGKSYEIQAKDEKEKEIWKSSLLAARRCWLLIDRASTALSEDRVCNAIEMISEARRAEGMLLNAHLLNLWGEAGLKCEKNNCAAAFNLNTYVGSFSLEIHCMTLASHDNINYILLGSSKGIIQILNMDGLSKGQLSVGEDTTITSLSIQHSTGILLSTCSNGKRQFWSFPGRKIINNEVGHNCPILCSDISRTRTIAVIGTSDGTVKEYDLGEFTLAREAVAHSGKVCDIAFNYTSKYFVSAGDNSELIVWDEMSFKPIERLNGHQGTINSICVNFDDQMISGGDDKKAILWDLKQLKQIKVLEDDKKSDLVLDHQSRIISVSLSQDIKWGLTADSNSKVILWNLKTGVPEVLCSLEDRIVNIKYLADSTGFLSCTNKNVEKWVFDWVLTRDGRDYPPPVWILLNQNKSKRNATDERKDTK